MILICYMYMNEMSRKYRADQFLSYILKSAGKNVGTTEDKPF